MISLLCHLTFPIVTFIVESEIDFCRLFFFIIIESECSPYQIITIQSYIVTWSGLLSSLISRLRYEHCCDHFIHHNYYGNCSIFTLFSLNKGISTPCTSFGLSLVYQLQRILKSCHAHFLVYEQNTSSQEKRVWYCNSVVIVCIL